jgi:hypothetical protein
MAVKGQRIAHLAQPVQAKGRSRVDCFLWPCVCSDKTCGGQIATHQPQPVQRWGSMTGRAMGLRGTVRVGAGERSSAQLGQVDLPIQARRLIHA